MLIDRDDYGSFNQSDTCVKNFFAIPWDAKLDKKGCNRDFHM